MPDLLTHVAASYVVAKLADGPSAKPWRLKAAGTLFCVGAVLPDVTSRGLGFVLPLSKPAKDALHTPSVVLLCCLLVAYLFEEPLRRTAFVSLSLGAGLHLLLDMLQKTVSDSLGYYWFFPFSWRTFQVPLFWPDETIFFIPVLLATILLFEWRAQA